jgi:hypothetical protein
MQPPRAAAARHSADSSVAVETPAADADEHNLLTMAARFVIRDSLPGPFVLGYRIYFYKSMINYSL